MQSSVDGFLKLSFASSRETVSLLIRSNSREAVKAGCCRAPDEQTAGPALAVDRGPSSDAADDPPVLHAVEHLEEPPFSRVFAPQFLAVLLPLCGRHM